jgi:hypothetical protein
MSEDIKEWAYMWGAKVSLFSLCLIIGLISPYQVKLRNDMPDDILRDAIETSRRIIQEVTDFETEGIEKYKVLFVFTYLIILRISVCREN